MQNCGNLTHCKPVMKLFRKNGLIPRKTSDEIKKFLHFAAVLLNEIKESKIRMHIDSTWKF